MLYNQKLAVSTGTNQDAIPSIKDLSGHLPGEMKVPLRRRPKEKNQPFRKKLKREGRKYAPLLHLYYEAILDKIESYQS